MKQGKSQVDFLTALKEVQTTKRDFVADTPALTVAVNEAAPVNLSLKMARVPDRDEVEAGGGAIAAPVETMDLSRLAVNQICQRLKIPFRYAERLFTDHPDLLANQVNALFAREPQKRMIRTLGGNVRAFLSDKFRIIDNFDVATNILPVIENILGINWGDAVRSCDVTESKMYIKVVRPDMVAEIPPPPGVEMGRGHNFFVEKVQAGIKISNSEVGLGRVLISPSIFTERCTNYATFERDNFAAVHLGRKQGEGADITELYSDSTKALDDAAIFAKIRDITKAALDGTLFNKHVEMLTAARTDEIPKAVNPAKVVEVIKDQKALTEAEADSIINNLIAGADLSRYGVHAAITRAAEDVESYDRATDLEVIGGQIIELAPTDWNVITQKAA